MSRFFSRLALILLIVVIIFALFIFWAKSPNPFPPSGFKIYPELMPKTQVPAPSRLKLMTYNIGYASGDKNNLPVTLSKGEVVRNLAVMVDTLKKFSPDVVALQEVDFNSARTFGINQIDILAWGLGLPYAAYVVNWNKRYLPWPYWPIQRQFGRIVSGQAILSRYPLEGTNNDITCFEKPTKNHFWYNWFYLDRCAQKTTLTLLGKKFTVWNVHLEAFDTFTRNGQIKLLAEWIRETNNNPLVLGDFNSAEMEGFRMATGLSEGPDGPTFPSWKPVEAIDHIFYSPPPVGDVKGGIQLGITASDHLPVWVELPIP